MFYDVSSTTRVRYHGDGTSSEQWMFYFQTKYTPDEVDTMNNAVQWCRENLGGLDKNRWAFDGPLMAIHDRTDAAAFKLRWC